MNFPGSIFQKMKIDQFEDYITEDLAWRKHEISQLFMILNESEAKDVVMRSIILLLYAHWEGFIKKSSKCYLKYVSESKTKIKDLTVNFKAITLKSYAMNCINSEAHTLSQEIAFMQKQNKMEEKRFMVQIDLDNELEKEIINTKDNLNSKVLKNICDIIGIKYNSAIQTRSHYIDSQLLNKRNAIGHGNREKRDDEEEFSFEKLVELKDFIITMFDYYTHILFDFVENKYYLCVNETQRIQYEADREEDLHNKLEEISGKRERM